MMHDQGPAAAPVDNSRWMASFSNKTLRTLFIPGTHDSSTWAFHKMDMEHPVFQKKWAQTQFYDFAAQLKMGCRYLDLRASWHTHRQTVVCSHSFETVLFDEALAAIEAFISQNPSEVIVARIEPDKLQLHVQSVLAKMESPSSPPGLQRWGMLASMIRARLGGRLLTAQDVAGHAPGGVSSLGTLTADGRNVLLISDELAAVPGMVAVPATDSPLGFVDSWAGLPAMGIAGTNTQGVDIDLLMFKIKGFMIAVSHYLDSFYPVLKIQTTPPWQNDIEVWKRHVGLQPLAEQANTAALALLSADSAFPQARAFRAVAMDYADPALIQAIIHLNAHYPA